MRAQFLPWSASYTPVCFAVYRYLVVYGECLEWKLINEEKNKVIKYEN